MKKIIFTLALLFSTVALKAQVSNAFITIMGVSSTTMPVGSAQWIDITYEHSYSYFGPNDNVSFQLYEEFLDGTGVSLAITYTHDQLNGLPVNTDGTSRVYFTVPSTFVSGTARFSADAKWYPTIITITSTTTAIIEPMESSKPGTVFYYNKNGILIKECRLGEVTELTGHYIYRILYDDKTIKSGQVYFSN